MSDILKVLYAADGGEPASAAISLLERFARRDAIEITAMMVAKAASGREEEDARAGGTVDEAVERLLAAGFKADGFSSRGHPATESSRRPTGVPSI